jgi:hypothetical protein
MFVSLVKDFLIVLRCNYIGLFLDQKRLEEDI